MNKTKLAKYVFGAAMLVLRRDDEGVPPIGDRLRYQTVGQGGEEVGAVVVDPTQLLAAWAPDLGGWPFGVPALLKPPAPRLGVGRGGAIGHGEVRLAARQQVAERTDEDGVGPHGEGHLPQGDCMSF